MIAAAALIFAAAMMAATLITIGKERAYVSGKTERFNR